MTPRSLDFFFNLRKILYFSMMFSLFWDTVLILSILPSGGPIRDPLGVTPRSLEHFFNVTPNFIFSNDV